jgi:cytochrome P450
MFGQRANVKQSPFYEMWRRNKHDLNTLGYTSVETHARRRKAFALAFTEQSTKATIPLVAQHVDRWNKLLLGESFTGNGWSGLQNLSRG